MRYHIRGTTCTRYKSIVCLEISEQFCLTRAQMCVGKEGGKTGQVGECWANYGECSIGLSSVINGCP